MESQNKEQSTGSEGREEISSGGATTVPAAPAGKSGSRFARTGRQIAAVAGCGVIIAAVVTGGIVSNRSNQTVARVPFRPSALKVTAPVRKAGAKSTAPKAGLLAGATAGMTPIKVSAVTSNTDKQVLPAKIEKAEPSTKTETTKKTEHETAKVTIASTTAKPQAAEPPKSTKTEKSETTVAAATSKAPSKPGKETASVVKTVALVTKTSEKPSTASAPTTRPSREAGEIYLILGSFPTKADAQQAQDRLAKDGVKCSIEQALPGWSGKRHAWFSLVSVDGFQHTQKSKEYDRTIKSLQALKLDPRPYRWRDAATGTGGSTSSSPFESSVATLEKGA